MRTLRPYKQYPVRRADNPTQWGGGGLERKSEIGKLRTEIGKLSTPSVASLFTQRRNGNCDPQRAQNDIKSFF